MSDNIADRYYRYSRRKRETNKNKRRIWTYNESKYIRKLVQTFSAKEKEIRMKRHSYTRKIIKEKFYSAITRWAASLFTYMQREKEREKRGSRDVPIPVQLVTT